MIVFAIGAILSFVVTLLSVVFGYFMLAIIFGLPIPNDLQRELDKQRALKKSK